MYKQRKIGDIKMSLVQGHLETFLSSQGHILTEYERNIIQQFTETIFNNNKKKLLDIFDDVMGLASGLTAVCKQKCYWVLNFFWLRKQGKNDIVEWFISRTSKRRGCEARDVKVGDERRVDKN